MKISDIKDSSVEREALEVICACNYYDLAYNVVSMGN